MKNARIYGSPPIHAAVIHGGPGALGEMQPVAQRLSNRCGVLEPFQTLDDIDGLVRELKTQLVQYTEPPLTLIGFSWGAWLSLILTAQYPELVRKLILIGSAPFEDRYAGDIMTVREARLSPEDKARLAALQSELSKGNDKRVLRQFGDLMAKADAYDPLETDTEMDPEIELRIDQFHHVWAEAKKLRTTGQLLSYGAAVQCPVVAMHGDYDPHPYEGVIEPLSRTIADFRSVVIRDCGHAPWKERMAHRQFYRLLEQEIAGEVQ